VSSANWPPTARQLAYLRQLANRAGQTFTTPRTREHASQEIERLLAVTNTGFTFAELQGEQAAREANHDLSISIKPHEIRGYGSNCTWSQRT
jgi:hypothetical protein